MLLWRYTYVVLWLPVVFSGACDQSWEMVAWFDRATPAAPASALLQSITRTHAASCWLSLCAPTVMHQPCVSSPTEATRYRKRRNRQLHGRHVIASSKRHLLYRQHFDHHTPTLCRPTHGM